MEKFTASEVRESAIAVAARDMEYEAEMLQAYADRLEADEKAVPVAWMVGNSKAGPFDFRKTEPSGWVVIEPLYTHPSPADAERLAEALQPFANLLQPHHASMPDDRPIYGINKAEITAGDLRRANEALAAHPAQAQPPAASVTDAMVNAAMNALISLTDENARLQYEVESRDMLLGTLNSTIRIWEGRAEKAEAERDALRKRIETAPVVTFERTPTGASWAHAAQTLADIGKKRVRLVVEE